MLAGKVALESEPMMGQELPRLTIAAQRLQVRKARIYWFGLQDQGLEDAFDTNVRP